MASRREMQMASSSALLHRGDWARESSFCFLHDGRTSDLLEAIEAHSSRSSEANGVISNFNALSPSEQQDLLNFLRSL